MHYFTNDNDKDKHKVKDTRDLENSQSGVHY